jgi:hypothetical protein
VPSASGSARRIATLALCAPLLAGALGGCTTTQETAARKQAESKRILERHERKREQRKAKRERSRG